MGPSLNFCDQDGWLVAAGALPDDPCEHDVPGLPILGCNNLGCSSCKLTVRTEVCASGVVGANADPRQVYEAIPRWPEGDKSGVRIYACHCHVRHAFREESIHHDYEHDEDLIVWKSDWSCAGHPCVDLPRTFDGVAVTVETLEALVDAAILSPPPSTLRDPGDGSRGLCTARLATRLDGTPHQKRVIAAVARHLTSSDLATRIRAVRFFADTVRFVAGMHPASLLGEHAALFVGVPNPHSNLRMTRMLDQLLWKICQPLLPVDDALRAVARAAALDPTRSCRSLFFALGHRDKAWFTENAVLVARAHAASEERREELMDALRATGLGSAAEAVERAGRPSALAAVLTDVRARIEKPGNDFTWSSWEGPDDAIAELDRHIVSVDNGVIPSSLSILFAPTGPLQEVAISSGWGDAFLALADRYDEAVAAQRGEK